MRMKVPKFGAEEDLARRQRGLRRWRDGFAAYACQHGELQASTLKSYLYFLDLFMRFLACRRVRTIKSVGFAELEAFFSEEGAHMSPRSLYVVRAALRSFLKYLYVEGELAMDLSRDLPRPSRFSADRRPKYLPWAKVEELLSGIDRSTLIGKRDYAMLTLLACHGLRVGEAAKLRVQDIDINEGSFFLRERKDGRCARLPLSARAKEALEDYMKFRGIYSGTELFLHAPPPRALAVTSIGSIIHAHLRQRFPSGLPFYGSHVLRHSFAKCLLDRGARLTDLGLLLGHRNLRSTLIYARIATEELREVSDNYARLL